MDTEDGMTSGPGDGAMAAATRAAGIRSIMPARPAPSQKRDDDETIADLLDTLNIDDGQTVKVAVQRQASSGRWVSLPAVEISPDMREEGLQIDQLIGHQFRRAGQYKWRLLVGGKYRRGGTCLIGPEFEEPEAPLDEGAFSEQHPVATPAVSAQDISTAIAAALAPVIQAATRPAAPALDIGILLREIKEANAAQIAILQHTMQQQASLLMKLLDRSLDAKSQPHPAPQRPPSLSEQLAELATSIEAINRIRGNDPDDDEDDEDPDDVEIQPETPGPSLTDRLAAKGGQALDRLFDKVIEAGEEHLGGALSGQAATGASPSAPLPASLVSASSGELEQLVGTFETLAAQNVDYDTVNRHILSKLTPEQRAALGSASPDVVAQGLELNGRADLAARVREPGLRTYIEHIQSRMKGTT